jgi:dihydroorotase/N-acyl-D-amino-acid deacylase
MGCFAVASSAEPAATVTVLRGGTVYTGDDGPPTVTDVWIQGDRIIAVGDGGGLEADVVIDVAGLAVAPGFIDLHSHAIRENDQRSGLYRWPDAENLLRQGITTVIGGPDGWSPLPLEDSFRRIALQGSAVNYGSFVGHGAVRERVMGMEDRPPTAPELRRMEAEVEQAMREGAFGLSSGLVYVPGSFANAEEIVALAKVAARHGDARKIEGPPGPRGGSQRTGARHHPRCLSLRRWLDQPHRAVSALERGWRPSRAGRTPEGSGTAFAHS